MSFLRISVFFSIFTLFLLVNDAHASRHFDFPGVVELVGYNNRKSRMGQEFSHGVSFVTPPMKKTRADIERVKQNIEEYNKLLKMDTKKLSEQQKDMLERIVERVARLKESLDIEVETTTETIAREEISNITETVTTLLPTTEFVTLPTTMLDAAATIKRDQSEARSNTNNSNNLNAKNNTGNHGKGKAKVRTNTSRRPASPTKPATKRTTGPRPSIKPTAAAIAITSSTSLGAYNGQKVTTITTIPPQMKQHQKQQQQQQDVGHDVLMKQQNQQEEEIVEQKTLPSITDHRQPNVQQRNPLGGAGVSADLIYDSNVTTSTIIDSLANHAREDYYNRDSLSESTNKQKQKPSGTAKPTKYHYYPHNQHIYLLPECAIQQVCNAVYVRLNYTQPLCACPSRYRDPCSASLNEDDLHTTKLVGDGKKKAITLAKTCEATTEMRECRSPKDWSLLALQNTRTGKSHYLVICRCPDHYKLEGPMAHDQPTYASVPGIRVFGMMCVKPGYSVRRPSVQPPKRYQLQKPYYIPNSNKYSANKDRPLSYQQESYQSQHQANYQYLNRPESAPIINSYTEFPESVNSFGGIYGRNNEQKGDTITAEEGSGDTNENKREKRSIDDLDDEIPEFPVHRLEEFQQSVIWD